jgi:hypothetical protein
MKIQMLVSLITVSTFIILNSAFGQGALTPPGAPAPTMKSLDQIEARTPVDATHTPGDGTTLFIISQPGAYYLTGNIPTTTNAIAINTNGVTLDLNGFTISSTASPASGTGITVNNASDVTILNGHIRGGVTYNGSSYTGPGFQTGVNSSTSPNVRISGISVTGCASFGIYGGAEVDHCTLWNIANTGISADSVNECVVYYCGGTAIFGQTIANSVGIATASGSGINGLTAVNCFGASTNSVGINCYVASSCRGETIGGYGINSFVATGCYGKSWGNGNAISATFASYCYGFADFSGTGVGASYAIGCYGFSNSGTGLSASYGNFCFATGAESVTTKYNMP